MKDYLESPAGEELQVWIKKQLDTAVQKLTKQDVIDSLIVEAKPAWVFPFQILIGKIRAQGQSNTFEWFICGEVPTDFLASSVASTAREAARHFSMKWQLEASRYQDQINQNPSALSAGLTEENSNNQLVEKAEALYELADDTRLWLQDGGN